MKVKELIKQLQQLDENREVIIVYMGDFCQIDSIDDTLNDYVEIEISDIEPDDE